MKYIINLFIITFLFTAESLFSQDSVSFPVKLELEGFQEVITQVGNIYISGQPDKEAFSKLKSEGVTTVINLRTQKEMDNREYVPFDEKALLDSLGMEYIHIPLGGSDFPYTNEALIKFADGVDDADGKVLLHCTVAGRASNMWAAYLIQFKGLSPNEAIEHARAINLGKFPLEGLLGKKLKVEFE